MLTHVFGMPVRRVATDLDFAISISDWSEFDLIKNCLVQQQGFSASSEMQQRIYFGANDMTPGVPLAKKIRHRVNEAGQLLPCCTVT